MGDYILIIEDDKEINNLLCKALNKQGFITKSAYTGPEGLNMLKSESFDIVLLDIMLPYKSGDRLLSELRLFSNIPVIVISAKENTQIKIDLLRLGADDYITKPFDIDEVAARIEASLRRVKNNREGNKLLKFKDIKLDTLAKRVFVNNLELNLTATEIKILEDKAYPFCAS